MTTYTGGGIAGVGTIIINIINGILVPLIFAIAFIMFVYGIAKTYILSHGEEAAVKEGHQLILWGLIGFFVMISVWGLVNIVNDTFGLGGQQLNRPLPTVPTGQSTFMNNPIQ
jgi:hypothetical protein